jgi:hypothetical protein
MTTPSVVDFTVEALQMNRRIMELEAEVERLSFFKEEYFKMVEHSSNLFGIAVLGALGDIEGAQALADS